MHLLRPSSDTLESVRSRIIAGHHGYLKINLVLLRGWVLVHEDLVLTSSGCAELEPSRKTPCFVVAMQGDSASEYRKSDTET
jgi:hypothetical protein